MKDVRAFGAAGDGITDDTLALREALKGGGLVIVPPGTYKTGTLYLESNTQLHLEAGAILRATDDLAMYNANDFCPQNRWSKGEQASGRHLITAVEKSNVTVEGKGCIDGNALHWMKSRHAFQPCFHPNDPERPGQMLFFCECENVTVTGVHLLNPTYWTCFFHGCRKVRCSDLLIESHPLVLNDDGIDIDCCQDVCVTNCIIHTGDDSIAVRGNPAPLKEERICENVVISNCVLSSTYAQAIRIGVGNGTIRECCFDNIVISGGKTGIMLVAKFGQSQCDGTKITDMNFSNIRCTAKRPLCFELDDRYGSPEYKSGSIFEKIFFSSCTFRGYLTNYLLGNGKGIIRDIAFRDTDFIMGGNGIAPGSDAEGHWCVESTESVWDLKNVEDILFEGTRILWEKGTRPEGWKYCCRAEKSRNIVMKECNFKLDETVL